MINKIDKLKKEILDKIYVNGVDSIFQLNLISTYPDYNSNQLKSAIKELVDNFFIEVIGYGEPIHYDLLSGFQGYLTDLGILYYENYDFFDENKYSIEIIRFLHIIKESNQEFLKASDIIEAIKRQGSKRTTKFLNNFIGLSIRNTCEILKIWPGGAKTFEFEGVDHLYSAIMPFGKEVLSRYYILTNLFKKSYLQNRDLLIEEYNSLEILIKNNLWKDACIKMGSILEDLLTDWIIHKNIPINLLTNRKNGKTIEKIYFFEKIEYYLCKGHQTFSNEIGTDTEWCIVQRIKEYRNYIHLQKYKERIKNSGPLTEKDYNALNPVFREIIKYF